MAKTGKDGEMFPVAGLVAARGRFQIKTWKGRPYAAKWPRKRGPKTSTVAKAWRDHFSCMAFLTKVPDPKTLDLAKKLTANTGWYYRDILTAGSVGKIYHNPGVPRITTPTFNIHSTTAESLTSGTAKVLTPTIKDWDNNVFWENVIHPTRATFKSAGLYLIGAEVNYNAVSGSFRECQVRLNGTTLLIDERIWPATANGAPVTGQRIWYFTAGDYIEVLGQANTVGVTATLAWLYGVGITPESVF